MPRTPILAVSFAAAAALMAAAVDAARAAQSSPPAAAAGHSVEDIYIGRSWRESRGAPTAFCASERTGFGPASVEDTYTFRSVSTRGSDGLVTDADVATIGRLHACFGPIGTRPGSFFYGEGTLGTVSFTGRGECLTVKQNFPEPGISVQRCFLDMGGLPAEYVGGQLTTNTIGSRSQIGEPTEPPGYTQPSIATILLWKRR
jgi:hypothetical protein